MNLLEIIREQQDPQLACELNDFVRELLPEFKSVLNDHPLKDPDPGCISVTEAFWLYGLVKTMQPETIIESGTLEGYSLYFLWRAASPQTQIFSFDPSNRARNHHPNVQYHACDWTDKEIGRMNSEKSLAFFDDHIHQGKRLKEAAQRGIRHVLFHDNYVSSLQSHVPIRWCNLLGLATHCYTFDRLSSDPIFTDRTHNPQGYRWLTYVGLESRTDLFTRTWRRARFAMQKNNPYHIR